MPDEYFDDLAFFVERDKEVPAAEPEPLKRVRVLPPYGVSHQGARFFPDSIAEVPESVADKWIKSHWVVSETPEVVSDEKPARKRGNRPLPQ